MHLKVQSCEWCDYHFSDNQKEQHRMTLLNVETIATFRELMDDGELRDFLAQAARLLDDERENLITRLRSGDWTVAASVAHRLKGGLGSVGCDALFSSLAALERNLKAAPPLPPAGDAVLDLEELLAATHAALEQAARSS
jgi:HPt (histidine-containing phosphotransfer) domain-containing protein